MNEPFSPRAPWIWASSDRLGYHYYLQARRSFRARAHEPATLRITADAGYQVWFNGTIAGHGPAKSAAGRRSVGTYNLTPLLRDGENQLDALVVSVGTGTMTYCRGEAGLIFEVRLPRRTVVSDARTWVRRDTSRARPTLRRWMLPRLEDVDTTAAPGRWRRAKVVTKSVKLYPRRVPLPQRVVATEPVRLPNFSLSFRLRPYRAAAADRLRSNTFTIISRMPTWPATSRGRCAWPA